MKKLIKFWKNYNSKPQKQLDDKYHAVMGGKNKTNPPFNIDNIIKQKYTINDDGDLIEGRAEYRFICMDGDIMLLKTLNNYAANSEDIFEDEVIKMNKKLGYNPKIGQIMQLHYMYADRFKVI